MLGPEGAINLIASRLDMALPGKVAELRTRLNLDDPALSPDEVPDLRVPLIMHAEPEDTSIELASFPAVYIVERNTSGTAVVERGQYADRYRIPYAITFLIYVRDVSFTETKAQLRRMALAVREVVLAVPQLADDDDQAVTLERSGWSEKFGTPGNQQNIGIIAGSALETVWVAEERIPYVAGPQVLTVNVDPRIELMG